MKDNMERIIHLNMAMIGGFIGGYAILNHCDLFGSAQTANMIILAQEFVGRDRADFFLRLIGLFLYMLGLASSVVIPRLFKNINMKLYSITVDVIALTIVSFIPEKTASFIALYPLFFATAAQWCSFKGMEGYNSSTIFSTNNLRQFTTAFTEYLCDKNLTARHKAKLYGCVLLSYHIGVALSYFASLGWGVHSAFIGLLPAIPAFGLILKEQYDISHAVYAKSAA